MDSYFLKKVLIWGFILWLIGYVLGIALFFIVPPDFLGWVISPIGVIITIWILHKKFHSLNDKKYFTLASIWTVLAIIFDYLLLVKVFSPEDGYYKLDVYVYYAFTFLLPIFYGIYQKKQSTS